MHVQVTGQAKYCDDIACPAGTLYAGLVMSTRPHARIVSVDTSAALKVRFCKALSPQLKTKQQRKMLFQKPLETNHPKRMRGGLDRAVSLVYSKELNQFEEIRL